MKCSDCGFPARQMSPTVLAKGSTVREPGEPLCEGCSSRRVIMVRQCVALPNSLADIRAKRLSLRRA